MSAVQEAETRKVADSGGLKRGLSHRQMTMIGLGGAIGTGLFLASNSAIATAGPAVIICYVVGAMVAMVVAWSLAEMTVVHPTRGSFGALAQEYLSPVWGFVARWTYWVAQVVAIGGEAVAAGNYIQYWWPSIPVWVAAAVFSVLMLGLNALAVKMFGEMEFWFASIKIVAIVVFLLLGLCYIFFGLPGGHHATGLHNLTSHGGFFPTGLEGMWAAMLTVIFSFVGVEVIAVAGPEATNPEKSIPRAIRAMVVRLAMFYILAMFIIVTIMPWTANTTAGGLLESPFVRVFHTLGIGPAAGIMNFVVLTAALSSMNANLFLTTRMAHSLAHDGLAPKVFGKVTRGGAPAVALSISAVGLAIAIWLSIDSPDQAYMWLLGISISGALFCWGVMLATVIAFRRRRDALGLPPSPVRVPGMPWVPAITILALVGIFASAFKEGLTIAWETGPPFVIVMFVVYWIVKRRGGLPEPAPLPGSRGPEDDAGDAGALEGAVSARS